MARLRGIIDAPTRRPASYPDWSVLGALCEFLPQADNRVTLADEKDRYGLPVADFSYTQCDNDSQLVEAATEVMTAILQAAGAEEMITFQRFAHLVGGCRMGADEKSGVVDADCRAFAVPNLLVVDGSVLPTQGSANPALTIMALASRLAARMVAGEAMDDDPDSRADAASTRSRRRHGVSSPARG